MKVIYAASRNLYPYMYPSIISLLEHNDVETIYMLLEDDEFPNNLPALPKECVIINVSHQTLFRKYCANIKTRFSYLSLMRAAYTKVLPKEDKLIQLDCDTIVTDSIEELWNVDLGNALFAAVEEELSEYKPFGPTYFNIGVAVFNLKKIRTEHIDDKVIQLLNTVKYPFIDQDVWNYAGAETAIKLPVRFNENFATGYTDNPAIVHYAGKRNWWDNSEMYRYEYLEKYKGDNAFVTNLIKNLEKKKKEIEIGEF